METKDLKEKKGNKAPAEKESFFHSLFASFFKNSSPEAEKKRKLKKKD